MIPSFSHIRIFGSVAWLLQKGKAAPPKGDKNEPRAIKGRYLGAASQRGHVVYVWIPSLHKIQIARDVTIVEKFEADQQDGEEPEWIAQWESDTQEIDTQEMETVPASRYIRKAGIDRQQDNEPDDITKSVTFSEYPRWH
jgi:hypothetical protein